MPRIPLIKTSSMGDVAHNLPVVGDLHAAIPDCRIDRVLEDAFSAIPVSMRRWRRHPF